MMTSSLRDDYDLIVFDCDGVLVDSEMLAIEIESEILKAAGFPLSPADIAEHYVGLSYTSMMADVAERFGRPVPDDLRERAENETLKVFPEHLRAVPGAEALLGELQTARCVASSSDLDRIRFTLGLTGLSDFFEADAVFSAQMVTRGKPEPDLFLHAAAEIGVDPANCLVIEDSAHGVRAGVAAGMDVVGLLAGGHTTPSLGDRLVAAGATAVLPTYSELAGLLLG